MSDLLDTEEDRNEELLGGGYTPPGISRSDLLGTTEPVKPEGEGPSLLDTGIAAINRNWTGVHALRHLGAEDHDINPDWSLSSATPEQKEQLYAGIPDELIKEYAGSTSLQHALQIRKRLVELVRYQETLAEAGGTGTALSVLTAFTDPVSVGAIVATEGLALPVLIGKMGKAGKIATGAAVGATTEAGIAAAQIATDPYLDLSDGVLQVGLGAFLGGSLAPLIKGSADEADAAAKALGKEILEEDDTKKKAFVVDEEGNVLTEEIDLTQGSAGAAMVGRRLDFLSENDEVAADAAKDTRIDKKETKGQFDMFSVVAESANDLRSALVARLVSNPSGRSDQGITASDVKTNTDITARARYMSQSNAAFDAWGEANGVKWWNWLQKRREFDNLVSRQRRDSNFTDDVHVRKVAGEIMDEFFDGYLDNLVRVGWKGADLIKKGGGYIPRVWRAANLQDWNVKYNSLKVNDFLARSLVKGSGQTSEGVDVISYEAALVAVEALQKTVIRGQVDANERGVVAMSRENMETVRSEMLADIQNITGKLSEEDISIVLDDKFLDDVIGLINNSNPNAGQPSRLKGRLKFDESFSAKMENTQTRELEDVSIQDLWENNATSLVEMYSRQVSGLVGLGQVGFRSLDELDAKIKQTERADVKHIKDDKSKERIDAEKDALDILRRGILGQSLDRNPKNAPRVKKWARRMRNFNFMRLMGQVGFAQVPEFMNAVGQNGFRAMWQAMPAMRGMFRRGANGELDNELLAELEAFVGVGTERLLNSPLSQIDDFAVDNVGFGRTDELLGLGTRFVADISLMAPINMFLERYAAAAAVQRFANKSKAWSDKRLASMGIDEDTSRRIHEAIKEHATSEKGPLFGKTVKSLNLAEWDPELADTFRLSLQKHMRSVIQKNDLGDLHQFMTTNTGKVLFQFRSFVQVAWAKQLLRGIHYRDMETFTAWSTQVLMGAMVYYGQTVLNAQGRDDKDEYLEKHLAPGRVIAAGWQRTGASSITTTIADTALEFTPGLNPVFNTRVSGTGNDMFSQFATADTLLSLLAVKDVVGDTFTGEGAKSRDIKRAARLLPLSSTLGARNAVNALADELGD